MDSYISRGEAKLRQLPQYFTGIPCKNGHLTYRYTSSGACSGCIRAHNQPINDKLTIERKAAKAQMVQVRLRCYEVDREALAAAVWSFALMRFPNITLGDVDPRLLPQDKTAGTGLYAFYCHSEDLAQVRQLADAMQKGHTVDVVAGRAKAIAAAQGFMEPDTTPPMSFK